MLIELIKCPRCGGTAQRRDYTVTIHDACGYYDAPPFWVPFLAVLAFWVLLAVLAARFG